MRLSPIVLMCAAVAFQATAAGNADLKKEMAKLQAEARALQAKLTALEQKVQKEKRQKSQIATKTKAALKPKKTKKTWKSKESYNSQTVTVHKIEASPESVEFYPTALVANEQVFTYIAGTPVVTSPYLGRRPAFDGSDYIVNISSINRDLRLMQQRRRLYRAYESIGYPAPSVPILALSGKVEPVASMNNNFAGARSGDFTLGTSELDLAASLNKKVEAYIGIAYDASPPSVGGPRVANSNFYLNSGFINIGDLDATPWYFTAGQLFVPFGRYSTSMVSAPLAMIVGRIKSRPFILGYKSQDDVGPFAAAYAYRGDTTLGSSGVGGLNAGYGFAAADTTGEVGVSYVSSMNDALGLQYNGAAPWTTFGGFSSITNGSEFVHKIPAVDFHAYASIKNINLTAEWLSATMPFYVQDLSYNGKGAEPQAGQLEASVTFMAFDKPSSFGLGYQWTRQALALNLPRQRFSAVFNTSIWKDTVESLEYRHDIGYPSWTYANGAAPAGFVNANTIGPGSADDTVLAQIGVYF